MGTPKGITITEVRHAWGFLIWEPSDGIVTRAQITLEADMGVLDAMGYLEVDAGMVLGAQMSGGSATFAALGTNTGNPTCGAISVAAPAINGEYDVVMTDATHFTVFLPDENGAGGVGAEVGHGVFGSAFNAGGLGFTITAGGTACVDGDAFKVVVTAGALSYAPFDPTQTNGLQIACAINGSYRKFTTTPNNPGPTGITAQSAALVRGPARVNSNELIWGSNVTTQAQKTAALAQLASLGILAT
jgi:hypothetical protein